MILTCERCETRFRLDASRLPAGGARVRCSRCKHAFFVKPEGAPPPEVVHQRAEAALTQSRPPTPAPSWDLDEDPNGRTLQSSANAVRSIAADALPSDFEEESDWRFEDEMQLGDTGASLDLPNGEAPAPPSADPNDSSFAELGDPESWDLLSTTAAPAQRAIPEEPTAQATSVSIEPVGVAAQPSAREERFERDEPVSEAPVLVLETEFSPALQRGAWVAVAALIVLASWATLVPRAPLSSQRGSVSLGALQLDSLRVRQVENEWAGPIWVVSGELHNPDDAPHSIGDGIAVSLLDPNGAVIAGASALAQPALPAAKLRETDPAQLRDAAERAASDLGSQTLAPDARIAIDAVFAAPVADAARFAVQTQPLVAPAAATAASAPNGIDPAQPTPISD